MAMDFRGARARVRSLIAAKKPGLLSDSALTDDALRDNIIGDAERHAPRIQDALRQRPSVEFNVEQEDGSEKRESFEWTTFGDCVRDIARASYGLDEPQLLPPEKVKPSHLFNREVEANVLTSAAFNEARPYTRDNLNQSWFGSLALRDALLETAGDVAAEHVARAGQMAEQEQQIEDAEQALDNLRELAKQQKQQTGQVDPNTAQQVRNQTALRQQARAKLGQLVQQHFQSNQAQAAAQLAAAAAQAYLEAVDALQALGALQGTGVGQATNLPLGAQMELAEKWLKNPALKKILRELGRLMREWKFKREARTKNVPVEPVSITTGRTIDRLVPHEMARAYMPELRPLWIKDYSERSLLEWQMEGKERAGKGPIVNVMDGSHSMSQDLGGVSRFTWASSLALTMVGEAQRTKRAFAGVEFGSSSELKSWLFPANEPADPDRVLDYATHFFGGGTDIGAGMHEALDLIKDEPVFKTADVILVSDGQCTFTEADKNVRDELVALGVRIHGISIGCPNNAYMNQMCEHVTDVTDLATAGEAVSAVAENLT